MKKNDKNAGLGDTSLVLLRRRLTGLYTVTTSLILTLVMISFFIIRLQETRQRQADNFYELFTSLTTRLQSDTMISQSFLAQTEAAHQAIIHIEENGTALLYPGSWSAPTSRQELIQKAKELAAAEGIRSASPPISASSVSSSLFYLEGAAGETYHAKMLVLTRGTMVRSLCLIMYRPPLLLALRRSILQLCLLEILGIAALFLISRQFVGWSLKPVAESRRRQAEFIAAASHELRSPLAVLQSGAAALRIAQTSGAADRPAKDPDAAPSLPASILDTFESECSRMSRLIDDMLLLASADAKRWELRAAETDMDTLLIEVYETYEPLCRQKDVSLRLELPKQSLPALHVDAERIKQISFILLDNALTYSPAGKTIRIRAEAAHAFVLRVLDQGPGIPDAVKPHIFDRFYRADASRSDKAHFGLGLSIALELARLHGGSLTVADAPGGGCCFTLQLPAK